MALNTTQPWPLPLAETIAEPAEDAPTTPFARAEAPTGEGSVDELLQSLRSDAIEARTEPMIDPASAARKADAVADALRGLREAQDRPWAPTPAAAATSDGARYAAHFGVHAIPRAAPPADPAAKVIINVTLPPAEPQRSPDPAEAAARHARTHVSLPRIDETVVVRRSAAAPSTAPRAPSRPLVALMTLGVVLIGGGGIVWAGFRLWSPAPVHPAAHAIATPGTPRGVVAAPVPVRSAEPPPELTAAAAPALSANDDALPGAASPVKSAATTPVAPPRRALPRPSAGRASSATSPLPMTTAAAAVAKPAPSPARAPASPSRPVQESFE